VFFLTNNGRLGQVYAGRFIAGLGIGQTTVIAPIYLSEISPKAVRGLCTCVFSGSVYVGIMLAYFASWGSSLHIDKNSYNSWVVPTSIHLMFAGIIFILSWFNNESPRFLIKKGKVDHAVANLAKLRGLSTDDEYITAEINGIKNQLAEEEEATMGQGFFGYVREMFCMPNNFYRIYLGLGTQLLGQWSGAQSITIYAPDMFALLGTKGQNEKLYATAIFWRCKVRRIDHLRLIPCRCHRTEAISVHRYCTSSDLHVLHCSFLNSSPGNRRKHRFHPIPEACFDWWHCHDIHLWFRLGNGMEQHPIPAERRDLSSQNSRG